MAKRTPNVGFAKPDSTEFYDIQTQNENWDKADELLKSSLSISDDYPGCYYRMVDGEIEWINPPMMRGVEYRTCERFLGVPVYVKTVLENWTPDAYTTVEEHSFETGITEDVRIVDIQGNYHYYLEDSMPSWGIINLSNGDVCSRYDRNTKCLVINNKSGAEEITVTLKYVKNWAFG